MKTSYGACTIDMVYDSRIIDIDEGFTRMLGYTMDDLRRSSITYRSLIVQDKNDESFKALTDNTVNNGMACAEHFIRRKNDSVIAVSCFGRNRGDGKLDIMITEDRKEWNAGGGGFDRLTGLYNYTAASAEIERLLKNGSREYNSCILIRLREVEKMDELYGSAFAGAIIENTAMYINHHYMNKQVKAVPCRLSRDTFLVFQFGRVPSEVERVALWVINELEKGYFGRRKDVEIGFSLGICHMELGDTDFKTATYNAGKALEYACANNAVIEVYDESAGKQYTDYGDNHLLIEPTEKDERIFGYDNRFVSFAVAMLSSTKDPESSLDVLLQRIAWKYHFLSALVCWFENTHYVRVTNRFERGKGIVVGEEEFADMNDWDNFMRSFDSNGISRIDDTNADYLSESDKEFFRVRGIGSAINFLLYDNGKPAGYASYCWNEPGGELDKESLSTLIQLSKIIEALLSQSIRHEEEEKRVNELSKDFVTGLYVLPAFHAEARRMLKDYDESKAYAVVHMDIDNFSYINTNYGRETGDTLLKMYSDIINEECGNRGIGCHIESDKFVCMLVRDTKAEIEEAVKLMYEKFHRLRPKKHAVSNLRSTSGIYFIEKDNLDLKDALYNANLVWRAAKNDRFAAYRIYDDEFRREREHRLNIIGSVRGAIENGEIEAFLQPKFSMNDMSVVGAEALCRWRNPDGRYKFPDQFIPILEEEGQIVDVDFCIFEQVLKALKSWEENGRKMIPVSVNFSRAHINKGNFAEKIIAMTKQYGIDPKYIEIEITESSISRNNNRMLCYMNELRENGFKLDMDDFGTGMSSLNMLIEAPIDVVKVDKSFIDKYENPIYRDYINGIGNLIITAQKEIIFEGVETQEQINFLTENGYENAQGYVFSRPIPLGDFEERYIYND